MPDQYSLVVRVRFIRRSVGMFITRKGICLPVTEVGYWRVRDSSGILIGEGFEGRIPAVMGGKVEQARAAAGVTEVELEGDAFVILVFGEGLEPGFAEEKAGIVEGMDEIIR